MNRKIRLPFYSLAVRISSGQVSSEEALLQITREDVLDAEQKYIRNQDMEAVKPHKIGFRSGE